MNGVTMYQILLDYTCLRQTDRRLSRGGMTGSANRNLLQHSKLRTFVGRR